MRECRSRRSQFLPIWGPAIGRVGVSSAAVALAALWVPGSSRGGWNERSGKRKDSGGWCQQTQISAGWKPVKSACPHDLLCKTPSWSGTSCRFHSLPPLPGRYLCLLTQPPESFFPFCQLLSLILPLLEPRTQGQSAQGCSYARAGHQPDPMAEPRCCVSAQGWLLRLCIRTSRSDAFVTAPTALLAPEGRQQPEEGAPTGPLGLLWAWPGSLSWVSLTLGLTAAGPSSSCTCVGDGTLLPAFITLLMT